MKIIVIIVVFIVFIIIIEYDYMGYFYNILLFNYF